MFIQLCSDTSGMTIKKTDKYSSTDSHANIAHPQLEPPETLAKKKKKKTEL